MGALDKVRCWVLSFPEWPVGMTVETEYLEDRINGASLTSLGMEQLSRKEDVTGKLRIRCRYSLLLNVIAPEGTENENAARVVDFQQWVQQQDAAGNVPGLGEDEHIRAEKGCCKAARQPGLQMYSIRIQTEFTKTYEVIE